MKLLKGCLRILKQSLFFLLSFIALYILAAYILSIIPVSKRNQDASGDIQIFILTNGVHTDIVVPAKSSYKDWVCEVPYADTRACDTTVKYLAFGWGDRGFYLETPTWGDLKSSTAFKALFHLGSSAMHCSYYRNMSEADNCAGIWLSGEEYGQLVKYVEESFDYKSSGRPVHIANYSYGSNDAFYEAKRTYDLFYTCNTWANNALKACGQKACLWTPSDKGIFYHYR